MKRRTRFFFESRVATPFGEPQTTGHEVKKMSTIVLYAYYEGGAYSKINLDFFLKHGLDPSFDLIIIVNGGLTSYPLIHASDEDKKRIRLAQRENTGHDFGAWSYGLTKIDMSKYEYFIFMNDTVIGPFYKTKQVWTKSITRLLEYEHVGIAGIAINLVFENYDHPHGRGSHVQTMMFAMKRNIVELVKPTFFNLNNLIMDRFDTITHREIGLSQYLLQRGYNIACLMKRYQNADGSPIDLRTPEQRNAIRNFPGWGNCLGNHTYDMISYFGTHIDPYETLFVKVNRNHPYTSYVYGQFLPSYVPPA